MEINFNIPFFDQKSEVQNYLYKIMECEMSNELKDEFNRPLKQTWLIPDSNCLISRISVYQSESFDWDLKEQTFEFNMTGGKYGV